MANQYNLIFTDNFAFDTSTGSKVADSGWMITEKITIQKDSVIFNQNDLDNRITIILYWDVNNNYLGFTYGDTVIDSTYQLSIDKTFVPNNADYFAIMTRDSSAGGNLVPQTTFSDFQNIIVTYATPIGIYKGRRNYLSFDGVNDYVNLSYVSQISKNNDFAIETDVLIPSNNVSDYGVFITNVFDGSDRFGLRYNTLDNVIETAIYNGSSYFVNKSYPIIYDEKINIKVSFINGNFNLIVNGNTATDSGDMGLDGANGFSLGSRTLLTTDFSQIKFYDLKIYNDNFNTLIHQYDFTEGIGTTLGDSVGNNDGSIIGATWGVEAKELDNIYYGLPSYSLSFDGVDDYVNTNNVLLPSSSDFSVFVEIDVNSINQDVDTPIFGQYIGSASDRFLVWISKLSGEIVVFVGTRIIETNWTIPTNGKISLTLTRNGSLWTVYLNGDEQITTGSYSGTVYQGTNTKLGGDSLWDRYSDLDYYDFRFYNRELSSNEVLSLNNGTDITNGLVTQYNFQEGSGNTLNDSIGNNDATIVGATWGDKIYPVIPRVYKGGPSYYLSFDGIDDYVDLGTLGNWASQNLDDWKIQIVYSSTSEDRGYLFGDFSGFSRLGFSFNEPTSPPNILQFRDNIEERKVYRYSGNFNDGNVNTLEFIYNNNQLIFNVNGVEQTPTKTTDETLTSFDNYNNFLLGAVNGGAGSPVVFSEIDLYDFKIYSGNTLFLHYDMSEGSGNTLIDKVGNNNATIVGATWNTLYDNVIYGEAPND
jgi:hypothetical protein